MDIRNPCLILQEDNSIVSPWDIVMKTLKSDQIQTATGVR